MTNITDWNWSCLTPHVCYAIQPPSIHYNVIKRSQYTILWIVVPPQQYRKEQMICECTLSLWWWSVMPIHMHDQLKTQYFVAEHIPSTMLGSVFVSNDIFIELWFLQSQSALCEANSKFLPVKSLLSSKPTHGLFLCWNICTAISSGAWLWPWQWLLKDEVRQLIYEQQSLYSSTNTMGWNTAFCYR
jgi:hypothetical protein